MALDPENVEYRTLHATATVGLGEHEAAIRGFQDGRNSAMR